MWGGPRRLTLRGAGPTTASGQSGSRSWAQVCPANKRGSVPCLLCSLLACFRLGEPPVQISNCLLKRYSYPNFSLESSSKPQYLASWQDPHLVFAVWSCKPCPITEKSPRSSIKKGTVSQKLIVGVLWCIFQRAWAHHSRANTTAFQVHHRIRWWLL